jgi:hypothetical protein
MRGDLVNKGRDDRCVVQIKRHDDPTPAGASYTVTTWDDETGTAEICEYDATDRLVCRREWQLFTTGAGGADRVVGEMRTFDPSDQQIGARPIWS